MTKNKHYPQAFRVASVLKDMGFRVLFAGGCVRDSVMGNFSSDIDIATSATPEEIHHIFPKTLLVGAHFGVVIVIEEGVHFEVATFRIDGDYTDGRRPDHVIFSDEKQDALRRDFTVNGLFFDPFTKEILDYVDGRFDIERKIIRTIGKPEDRFNEDKLRLLRAIRFSAKLGFEIEQQTINSIKAMAKTIVSVSRERIRDELFKIFSFPDNNVSLNLLKSTGLWEPVFQFKAEPLRQKLCQELSPAILPEFKLFALNLPADEKSIAQLVESFKLSRRQEKNLHNLLQTLQSFEIIPDWRLGLLKKFFKITHFQEILEFLKKWQKIFKPERENIINLIESQYLIHKNDLEIDKIISGDDLKELGVKPSPVFRQILEEIELQQLEKQIITRADALKSMKKLKESHES